jgi:hypothetical protein
MKDNAVINVEPLNFISCTKYHAHHHPTNEDWVILGVNIEHDEVCAAGWPPTIGKLSDCSNFEAKGLLSEHELHHRVKHFGYNWL